jgi:hypothetical protein
MNPPIKLAFTGIAYAGKSTAAEGVLQGSEAVKIMWASPVKYEIYSFLTRLRQGSVREAEMSMVVEGLGTLGASLRSMPLAPPAFLGDKPAMLGWVNANKEWLRPLLQWWGTDYRRSQDVNYWVDQGLKEMQALPPHVSVVSDDTRFENEYRALKMHGFTVVRIERPGIAQMGHASEKLDIPYDLLLHNNFKTERDFMEYVRDNATAIFNCAPYLSMTKANANSPHPAKDGNSPGNSLLLAR